ncbi:hypothetical protein EVAR_57626_1 [Eumeta japonica]|uniref:Uncharacterized protein n=1 Tax=Eumeta variegata TaxID=151549 RepID=A0A4C1ZSH1_EUMVA|nr:hypothetical protein EVAR_57626_1 [Eumeta japonica]
MNSDAGSRDSRSRAARDTRARLRGRGNVGALVGAAQSRAAAARAAHYGQCFSKSSAIIRDVCVIYESVFNPQYVSESKFKIPLFHRHTDIQYPVAHTITQHGPQSNTQIVPIDPCSPSALISQIGMGCNSPMGSGHLGIGGHVKFTAQTETSKGDPGRRGERTGLMTFTGRNDWVNPYP